MKYILFLLVVFLSIIFSNNAFCAEETLNLAGAGALVVTSPYAGVPTKTIAMPFLVGEYKGFYIKGAEAGYHLFQKDPWVLSVITAPRFMGYSSEDSSALNGMEDRKMSWDAGVKVTYALPNDAATLTAKALADVLSRYDGASYELSIGKEIKGRIFRLTPSLGVRYLDRALTGYYYGVEGSEVRAGRSAYTPHAAVDPFADVVFTCGISEKLIIVTKVGVESLDSQIRNSPIVDENYVLSAAAGLTYRF